MTSLTPTSPLPPLLADDGWVGLLLVAMMLRDWWRSARAMIRLPIGDTFIVAGALAMLAAPHGMFVLYLQGPSSAIIQFRLPLSRRGSREHAAFGPK